MSKCVVKDAQKSHQHVNYADGLYGFSKTVKVKFVQVGVFVGKPEFFPLSAADAELMDTSVSQKIMTAADDTGMA
jgi:hypothetical protein